MARRSSLLVAAALLAALCLQPPAARAQGLDAAAGQAAEAGVPASAVARVRGAVEAGALGREDGAAVLAELARASGEGLPVAPFAAKVEEGLAKGVSGPAIVRALDAKLADYAFARQALAANGRSPDAEAVAAAGESLRQGLSRDELSALAAVPGNADAAMVARAAHIKALLDEIGFSREASAGLLGEGLARASLAPSWLYLSKVVLKAREKGVSDARLAQAARDALSGTGSFNEFMQDIGFTTRNLRGAPGESGTRD
ncbi:hypothetical protein dsx2_0325 [Desulfovibrio sp. X2]|uniref:hypothetical protein n=1 Tax=Desulfovibrio sp. X2 TaxID=941449 RepID=UPI000358C424|nr:hypothetical protein [Desulfovibrio sp. X2]EPR41238.1 hypothetical protein dsx2_0325 [Desulfovibrio sp. X2]